MRSGARGYRRTCTNTICGIVACRRFARGNRIERAMRQRHLTATHNEI
jgi:hypothetical protein